jgi:serine/threonine protein kinase
MAINYKYVAMGGFGFVISPNIIMPETSPETYNLNTVSKIFMKKNDALIEYDNHKIINRIDPEYRYHLKMLNSDNCHKIMNNELRDLNIYKLPHHIKVSLKNSKYYYINYDFGGLTLPQLFDSFESRKYYKTDKTIYLKICGEFLKLIQFVKLLLDKRYIHHDLKHNNILIDNNLTFKTIDFGLMEYIPDYIENCTCIKNTNPMELFEYFPFEIEYYNVNNYNNCVEISKGCNYRAKLSYLKNKYKYFYKKYLSQNYGLKYNEMITLMTTTPHIEFLNASFNTFDIYTLGITLIFLTEQYMNIINIKRSFDDFCDRTEYSEKYSEWIYFDSLYEIICKMITPNVFERITIDELIVEFEKYLVIIYERS